MGYRWKDNFLINIMLIYYLLSVIEQDEQLNS